MIFRQATQEDLTLVKSDPFEGVVKDYPYMEIPDVNCYTALFEGEVAGVGGLVMKWEGVGLLWLMLTSKCRKDGVYGFIAAKSIKEKMEELIAENNLWRAEATVRSDFPKAIKMIEAFGFKREGLMEKYCPDKSDAYLYARVI